MAQQDSNNSYKQGHSDYTTANHERRTAEVDAAFLLPYIKKSDHILDVGCGPGTITTGLAKYATEGKIVGLDLSENVLEKAQELATDGHISTEGPGSVTFEHGNVLNGLPYPDNTFDIVYSSQVLGHMPLPDGPRQALEEMRRVLKPGGLLASRDGAFSHFHPSRHQLDRLWGENLNKMLRHGSSWSMDTNGARMPEFYRSAGFDTDDGDKVKIGAGSSISTGKETRTWLAWRAKGQLTPGDPFYKNWREAGISEEETRETLDAVQAWADTEDAWLASLQCEMLAWK
ncbi:arsenite methyltransferase [Sporothrix schenckii 1099-18]|uniref:Arsenite methyltransferase n=1 Tax=Sporothrix schenckii 1099-18 TaxID=1397361 RepID=A0A0F2M636_SPOSC|nr:arsenite methyltransferase [Sporothrix schenckii 1099-18]KJR83646.1 arsenite methyltransferase [Sporothrix schenckii 1099-18]